MEKDNDAKAYCWGFPDYSPISKEDIQASFLWAVTAVLLGLVLLLTKSSANNSYGITLQILSVWLIGMAFNFKILIELRKIKKALNIVDDD